MEDKIKIYEIEFNPETTVGITAINLIHEDELPEGYPPAITVYGTITAEELEKLKEKWKK